MVYLPALNGGFLWDDSYLVQENPFFKSPIFLIEVFRHWLFLDSFSVYYRPVQNISYMLDYWIWNGNAFGYHLSSICLHALAGCLLFCLLRSLLPSLLGLDLAVQPQAGPVRALGLQWTDTQDFRGAIVAFLVALIWVVHPVHNAAVAYVSGRADTLAALFAMMAWLIYAKTAPEFSFRNVLFWVCAALLALAALCSKEIALLWIVLFGVYAAGFDRSRSRIRSTSAVAVLAGIVAVYSWLRHLPPPRSPLPPDAPGEFSVRFLLMLRALGDYVGLIFYPSVLRMDRVVFMPEAYLTRVRWEQNIRFEYLSILGAAALVLFVYFGLKRLPGRKVRLFGAIWFLIGFFPISNLFPLNAQVAEHWIYMPSAGLLLFLGGCVLALPARYQRVAAAAILLYSIALSARTWVRAEDWADPVRFYRTALESGSDSPRIRANLALVYSAEGNLKAAEKELRAAVERYPDFATARINLGINLMQQGRKAEAEPFLKFGKAGSEEIAKRYPHTWSAALNLAGIRYEAGRREEALAIIDDGMVRFPEIWELVKFKSRILSETDRLSDAVALVSAWRENHWWHYDSCVTLGRLLQAAGRPDDAIASLRQAARLDIHAFEPFNLIAQIEMKRNQAEIAFQWEMKAIKRAPDQPLQYVFLSVILNKLHRDDASAKALRQAEELAR